MHKRSDFNFFHRFRVRYSEIDGQGIVFNAHYLTYFDTAVTEYIRNINIDYNALIMERGIDFHLVKATVEFYQPVNFDDLIDVGVNLGRIGNSSLTWVLSVFRKGCDQCLTGGELIWVCTRLGTNKSFPLPEDLVGILKNRLDCST